MLSTCRSCVCVSRNFSRGYFVRQQRHAKFTLKQPLHVVLLKRHSSGTSGVMVKMLKRGVYTILVFVGVPGVAFLMVCVVRTN